MKALVTGGAGFIGSWIVDYLIDNGFEVSVLDNLSTGRMENLAHLKNKIKFYQADIRGKYIKHVFEREKPYYVFHCAAEINVRESLKNPEKCIDVNVNGGLNLLENCVKYEIKKFIFSSTGGAIYGDNVKIPTPETEEEKPTNPYGKSKLLIDRALEDFRRKGLDYVSLRYSNVYGPRQNSKGEAGVIAIFIDNLLSRKKPRINGSGEQTRDYVYVRDVAKANLLVLNSDLSGIFNVGTGIETDINEIYQRIINTLGLDVKAEHGPAIDGEQMRSCLDSKKLINKGWKPEYDLDSGLEETIIYFKGKIN